MLNDPSFILLALFLLLGHYSHPGCIGGAEGNILMVRREALVKEQGEVEALRSSALLSFIE